MPQKRNDVPMRDIENKTDRYWYSIIKELSEDTHFGTVQMSLTIKNGEITNIQQVEQKKNFNIKN